MLRIARATYDAIVAHARQDHPDEACGVVAGPEGTDRPERVVPMLNAARSPTFYEFDSTDLLALYRELDDRDEWAVVVYHSHTATEAYPSRTDVGYASGPAADPRTHYVLVSTRHHGPETGLSGDEVEFRSYRIVDGEVSEEEVEIVETHLFGHSPTTVVYD
ncbi:Mov34/MPN/PAD-1 family protein [Blastococcus saxobsidens]|uniref:Proteasome lid subunit RPN8/RPN11 n=1 Tax=Blastococcus saxobsidens TaxID=138336 RepID=A0A4V2G1U2_9ACTN|nr:M67 family metallopeptidase [Blastococcus saxobsidens]RZU30596.1 proteasome lid subunit RPN8/RPN11 [Blastococcus saxobsidens]